MKSRGPVGKPYWSEADGGFDAASRCDCGVMVFVECDGVHGHVQARLCRLFFGGFWRATYHWGDGQGAAAYAGCVFVALGVAM